MRVYGALAGAIVGGLFFTAIILIKPPTLIDAGWRTEYWQILASASMLLGAVAALITMLSPHRSALAGIGIGARDRGPVVRGPESGASVLVLSVGRRTFGVRTSATSLSRAVRAAILLIVGRVG